MVDEGIGVPTEGGGCCGRTVARGWVVPALGGGATESSEGGGGAEGGELFGVGVTVSSSPRSSLVYPACTLHGPVWLGTASGSLRILTLLLGTLSLQIRGI